MAQDTPIYGEVNSKTDLEKVFRVIRQNVDIAKTRPTLTELYRRAGYLITLTHAPSWRKKYGRDASKLRVEAEEEFGTTARRINQRAKEIGSEADYDEKWGD